jgi:predicted transcriptional regulator
MSGMLAGQERPVPSNLNYEQIEERAREIAGQHGFVPGRDHIRDLARRLGGRIEVVPCEHYEELEGGSLKVHGPGDFTIRLSPITGILRDNFTIAHELGHYFLHTGTPPGSHCISVGRWGTDMCERQANRFAAALLMPRPDFAAAAARFAFDLGWLAARFNVSLSAAEVRARSLGLVRGAS